MRLCLLRDSEEIPLEDLTQIGGALGSVLSVSPETVSDGSSPIGRDHAEASRPAPGLDDAALSVIFTLGEADETVVGEGVSQSRTIQATFRGSGSRSVRAALHAIGHVCGATHCTERTCAMYPYAIAGTTEARDLGGFFCVSCRRMITESWIHSRLHAATEREGQDSPASRGRPSGKTRPSQRASQAADPRQRFPDWSLPREEFVTQVKQFFGYE